ILTDGVGLESLCCAANGRILRDGDDTGLRVDAFGQIREDVLAPALGTARAGYVVNADGEYVGRLALLPVSEG
ncbi:MAG: hypothetical protein PVH68_18385, partial [Armatimonadota bacterium]